MLLDSTQLISFTDKSKNDTKDDPKFSTTSQEHSDENIQQRNSERQTAKGTLFDDLP